MTDNLRLIRITPENRTAFYNLFAPPFDPAAKECTWLHSNPVELTLEQRITAFLEAEDQNVLKELDVERCNERFLFKHNGAALTEIPQLPTNNTEYEAFIQQVRTLIAVELHDDGKSAFVLMDPLPLGDEIAILFRADAAQPWEFATAKTIPKTEYVEQLIAPYTNVTGLHMQLGITYFADGTKVLNRFYMSDDEAGNPVITAATLNIIDKYGRAETVLTNEDFLVESQFLPKDEWLAIEQTKYGEAVSFDRVTSGAQCAAFFANDPGQFSISKTGKKNAAGRTIEKTIISGSFLQLDRYNTPLIQSSKRSVLEGLINVLRGKDEPLAPPPSPTPTLPNSAAKSDSVIMDWVGDNITKVTKTPEGAKIELGPTAHLIASEKNLSLQGDAQEEHLRAMLQHAKEHWGGGFRVDSATDEEMLLLRQLATEMKVTLVEVSPSTAARPAPSARGSAAPAPII